MAKQPTRKPTPPRPSHPSTPIREGGGNKGVTPPPRRPQPPKK